MQRKNRYTLVTCAIVMLGFQSAALATQPQASANGAVSIGNTIKGNFSVGTNGTSTSYAQNNEAATATVTATKSYTPNYSTVSAGVSGSTTTDSYGKAYNISTGSGSGTAMSSGFANASTSGTVSIHGVTSGFNGGNSSTQTSNLIEARTNQGSYVAGQTLSGFDVQVDYSRTSTTAPAPAGTIGGTRTSTVSIADQKEGYASGATVAGALEGMNAAGLAQIGASGQFFAKTNLSATTGTVTAP